MCYCSFTMLPSESPNNNECNSKPAAEHCAVDKQRSSKMETARIGRGIVFVMVCY